MILFPRAVLRVICVLVGLSNMLPSRLQAQDSSIQRNDVQQNLALVSRAEAIHAALTRGARLVIAGADTANALAQLLTARALPNPTISMSYSKATPQYHILVDFPFDWPSVRRLRVQSAQSNRTAAQYRFAFERAATALDADTTYTRALAAFEHARLSRHNARDADSLRSMAVTRRNAGDASDLDVALATVNAGQAANVASTDSLAFLSALLDLQAVMGLDAHGVVVTPTDSLTVPSVPTESPDDSGVRARSLPLQVAAAQATFESAKLATQLQHHSLFASPSLTAGVEAGDPTRTEPGLLPIVGIALPLPFFNRNRGPIVQAEADQTRARAELAFAKRQSDTEIARLRRELTIALAKIDRDRQLITAADRVAALSLTAYREGASALPNVLEAQRNAREVLAQYVDDLTSACIASAELRVLTITSTPTAP